MKVSDGMEIKIGWNDPERNRMRRRGDRRIK